MLSSALSTPVSEECIYTDRERELLDILTGCCNANHIKLIINPEKVNFGNKNPILSLDVEHNESGEFVGCGLCISSTVWYYSDLVLLRLLDFRSFSIVAHNGVTDLECLRHWGINVTNNRLYWDTELMGHILDSSRKGYGLKKLSNLDLGISYPSYDDIVGKRTAKVRRTLDKWPIEIVSQYNALDCYVTYKLYELQVKGLY